MALVEKLTTFIVIRRQGFTAQINIEAPDFLPDLQRLSLNLRFYLQYLIDEGILDNTPCLLIIRSN